ncbi:MAG: hypothetical protein R3B70_46455 [Polyangiaceae bacterium]
MTCTDSPALSAKHAPRGASSAARTYVLAGLFLAALAALGCAGEINVENGETTSGETATDPTATEETCDPGAVAPEPDPAPVALTGVQSGCFIGNTLHLEALVDDVAHYVVLDIDEEGIARAAAVLDDLLGSASLTEAGPGLFARLRADDTGASLDVIDAAEPTAPKLLSNTPLPGTFDGDLALAASQGHVFYCARPSPEEKGKLYSVDLADPKLPAEPESIDTFACYFYGENTYSAAGASLMHWNHPTGNYVQDAYLYTLSPGAAKNIVDYGYNQTGVHMYGNVVSAAMSETRTVLDAENKTLFLLLDSEGSSGDPKKPSFTWASFAVSTERHLLTVADTTAYLVTPEGLRAYDITDLVNPVLTGYEATFPEAQGALRAIATSPRYLALADEKGTLFLAPRDTSGPVAPLVVHGPEYAPPAKPSDCDD